MRNCVGSSGNEKYRVAKVWISDEKHLSFLKISIFHKGEISHLVFLVPHFISALRKVFLGKFRGAFESSLLV